ncbi:hypothetical protein [Prauserella cavernicola]|uniref:Secreted protein n=1 Tax=Prauserella cavernicola TaxID=2800127 RepID=A0A934QZT6_9PSEU|nr:hypothetical protein [Prauserella cavernicola]MBK1789426.1 hypothetical protein [Prauserella cavernicola]
MRTTIRRTMIASALALPLALGTAGFASADTGYDEQSSMVGPDGASTSSVSAQTGENGSSFEHSSTGATSDGAWSESTEANADANGGTSFEHNSNSASGDGASSHSVTSNTDGGPGGPLSGVLGGLGL